MSPLIKLENGQEVHISQESYDALKEGVQVRWKPKQNDQYFFLTSTGRVDYEYWNHRAIDEACLEFGNVFKTKEEAEYELLRIKSLREGVPVEEGKWVWGLVAECTQVVANPEYRANSAAFNTEEEAREWGRKYHDAWMQRLAK